MKQKSKLVSLLLTLCMALTLLPAAAFAQETIAGDSPAKAQGVAPAAQSADGVAAQASTPTKRTTELDLTDKETTASEAEGWSWDANKKTLTLSGCDIEAVAENYAAITLPDGATIITAEGTDNVVKSTSSNSRAGIDGRGSLTIGGSGSLSVSGGSGTGSGAYGITATGTVTINAPISVTGDYAALGAGVDITFGNSMSITSPTGGTVSDDGYGSKYITGSDGQPAKTVVIGEAAAAPVFTDGFGNTITNANTYKAGTTTNDKGYTFAGWFGENGTELTDITTAASGATYTAKWTKNGTTVRTAPLDLRTMSATTNKDEGWSWDGKTLTLSGVMFDVNGEPKTVSAITLPEEGATITTAAGTKNTVIRTDSTASAITGIDNLTISGTGSLYVEGDSGIFVSRANASTGLTINAPLTAKSNSNRKDDVDAAIWVDSGGSLTIGSSLKIQTPTNGKVITRDSKTLIVDAGNKAAMEVVIASAGSVVEPTITDLKLTPATASVEKGKTQQFKATMTITPAGVTPTLTWSVTGNKSNATKIDQTGLLTVGADETATTLTVTVSASVDGGEAVGATATVTVTAPSTSPKYYYKNTGTTSSSNTPNKSPKTADAGIALYAGMAAASLLGSGVVLNRKRKNF